MGRSLGLFRLAAIVGRLGACAILLGVFPVSTWAYIQTLTPAGLGVHWPAGSRLNLAGNFTNTSGLSAGDVFDSVTRSLQRWREASGGAVDFGYWQGSDARIYEPDSNYNGLSSVYFASNSSGATGLTANILGLTQVWYNSDSGAILEADTVLNDIDFEFTRNPKDTSGFGSGSLSGPSGHTRVYVENVLTHEFGHSLGLAHSAGLQSTMLFMESPEQAHLGCDEEAAIREIYPTSGAAERGSIAGKVISDKGAPIFGAYVEAISRVRGTSLGGGITDPAGRYRMGSLEPGAYYLMVEPYLAGASALPSYYASIDVASCGGQPFHRSFLTDPTGHFAQAVEVTAGAVATVPDLTASCQVGTAFANGAFVHADDPHGFGVVDVLGGGGKEYKISGLSGHLVVHANSFSLYSPIHVSLALVNANGAAIPATVTDKVYIGDSDYVNFDSSLVANDLPLGDYVISASPDTLRDEYYPAGPLMMDATPFALISASINEGPPALAAELPNNARCRRDENFAAYQSPPGNPPRASVDNGSSGAGFCATISATDGEGKQGGGPGAVAIAGWWLPWIAMGALARVFILTGRRRLARARWSG